MISTNYHSSNEHKFTIESLRARMDANCVGAYSEMSNEHMWRRRHRAAGMSWRTPRTSEESRRSRATEAPELSSTFLSTFWPILSASIVPRNQSGWSAFAKKFEMVTYETAAEIFCSDIRRIKLREFYTMYVKRFLQISVCIFQYR